MSEEEIINTVDKFIDVVTVILPKYSTKIPEYCIDEKTWIAIKGLLDLYNKEKEKNRIMKAEFERLENIEDDTAQLKLLLKEEKEKNKTKIDIKDIEFSNFINERYISKDKIREKIEYLDNQQKQWIKDRELKVSDGIIIFVRDVLKELLER